MNDLMNKVAQTPIEIAFLLLSFHFHQYPKRERATALFYCKLRKAVIQISPIEAQGYASYFYAKIGQVIRP